MVVDARGKWLRGLALAGLLSALAVALTGSPARAGWVLPAGPVSPQNSVAFNPEVVVGPDGRTTVAWQADNGFADIIQATTRTSATGPFPAPVFLSQSGNNSGVELAVSPEGETVATWVRDLSGSTTIQFSSRLPGGSTFSSPLILSSGSIEPPTPEIAAGPDGLVTAVFTVAGIPGTTIQAVTRPGEAQPFGSPTPISAGGTAALYPRVAIGSDGTTTAVWQRWNGSANIIQAATRPPGAASFQAAVNLSQAGQNSTSPEVAFAPDGTTTVVWQSSNGTDSTIQAAIRQAGAAGFQPPTDISTPEPGAAGPRLAVGPDGQVTVVWQVSDSGGTVVRAATRVPGASSFSGPLDLSGLSTLNFMAPRVVTGADGTTTVAWASDFGSGRSVQAVTRKKGSASFSAPLRLSGAAEDSSFPRIATGRDGRTVVVWPTTGEGRVQQATRLPDPLLARPSVKGPSKAKPGRKTTYRVRVRNIGFGRATGILIRARGKGLGRTVKAGNLAGRKTKTVKVPLKFTKKGRVRVTFTVTSNNAGKKTVKKVVRVK